MVRLVSFSKALPKYFVPSTVKKLPLYMRNLKKYLRMRTKDVKLISFSKSLPKCFAPSSFKPLNLFLTNLKNTLN